MMSWLNTWTRKDHASEKKDVSQRVQSMLACNILGQPVWTPRRYDALADEGYQQNVIVYRCVNLIAKGAASVPWLLYQVNQKGRREVEQHPLLSLLAKPNPQHSRMSLIETMISYYLLSGNAYVEAVLDQGGQPQELHTLRPDRVSIIPGSGGVPAAYTYGAGSQKRAIPVDILSGRSRVFHLKSFHPLNDWYGMSPIEAASRSIDQHNAVSGHNLALLQNGGRPSGALLVKPNPHKAGLTDEQRDSLRQDLKRTYEGSSNAGRVMVLEGDFEWKEMGLSPKDLDFVEGKNLSAREIAQAYGVPPMLVGVPGDATFANYREARYHLWEDTILPILDQVIAGLNQWLLPQFDEGLSLTYDADSIHALAPRREAVWSRISQADFLTLNEKREALGYTPLEKGDVLEGQGDG